MALSPEFLVVFEEPGQAHGHDIRDHHDLSLGKRPLIDQHGKGLAGQLVQLHEILLLELP